MKKLFFCSFIYLVLAGFFNGCTNKLFKEPAAYVSSGEFNNRIKAKGRNNTIEVLLDDKLSAAYKVVKRPPPGPSPCEPAICESLIISYQAGEIHFYTENNNSIRVKTIFQNKALLDVINEAPNKQIALKIQPSMNK